MLLDILEAYSNSISSGDFTVFWVQKVINAINLNLELRGLITRLPP